MGVQARAPKSLGNADYTFLLYSTTGTTKHQITDLTDQKMDI